ncbi:acyl carrier protein [Actinomadura logoneensis]|uniref:Acyl carrier protein n=1 Tax=Actinomadura logoneensis TaxID=2293572 RepID=A0A372JL02_9ACTN|nr:acyl carrier protein [Actinomadura logoneensis]RFU40524.1 acyl carrier protein [Actinomadura logoneensis]
MRPDNDVLAEVVEMLTEVVGEDFLLEQEVGPDTAFNADLGLESIEFVALAERLQRRYGRRIEFAAFIAGMDLDQIMNMTVGDLTAHISARLAAPAEDAPAPDAAPDAVPAPGAASAPAAPAAYA